MKQAKKIQEKIASMQAELESRTVEATAGGGMVAVV
ncbi:MAG: YbaB/EbfC family nucleoid-associated protein, partial [Syntrophaceae bacterium]|nr:YbaB/EbfC family nucleoid-associated protein [Syntrophaceae bacterium]